MRDSKRAAWTAFVEEREARKSAPPARKPRRSKKPQTSPAELEQALDDLTAEHQSRERAKGGA